MALIFATLLNIDWRFWSKVDPNGPVPPHAAELGPCWVWVAATDRYGYGAFKASGRKEKAHRYACRSAHGRPFGRANHVLHACDNRLCCRPDHIRWGTNKQNVRDRVARAPARTGARCALAPVEEMTPC